MSEKLDSKQRAAENPPAAKHKPNILSALVMLLGVLVITPIVGALNFLWLAFYLTAYAFYGILKIVSYLLLFMGGLIKHGLVALLIVVIVIFATLKGLDVYTHHGDTFATPNFEGLSLAEAEYVAKQKNLLIEISDSVYVNSQAPGSAIDQHPKPGHMVKQERTVFLTINAFGKEQVQMPDITNQSIFQATADLETYGLQLGRLIYIPDIAANFVLGQKVDGKKLNPGDMVDKGTEIDLELGTGVDDRYISPPWVVGFSKQMAIKKAKQSFFNVGKFIYDESVLSQQDSARARVWKQDPAQKLAIYKMGAEIDLYLSVTKAPEEMPDIKVDTLHTADTAITEEDRALMLEDLGL